MPDLDFRFPLIAIVTLGLSTPAWAQDVKLDPGSAVEAKPEDTDDSDTSEEADAAARAAEEDKPETPGARVAEQPPKKAAPRKAKPAGIVVRDVQFTKSSYLSDAELAAVRARFVGRRLGNAGLTAIPAAVNQLYAQKGIVTAQAILRSVRGGRAEVELLEARVGQVRATEGNISDGYFKFRLGMPSGTLADNRVIEERVQRLQITDALPVQLTYAPGTAYGTTDIILAQPDLPKHVTTVTIDNYGSPAQGELQFALAHTIRSLTGWNDPLTLSATIREGARGGSLAYARTITPGGGTIALTLGLVESENVTGVALTGSERTGSLTFSQPVIVEQNRRVSFSAGIAAYRETADLAGVRTLDQTGAELILGASFYQAGQGWSVSVAPRVLLGRYADDVTGNSRNDYAALQGNVFASVALGKDAVASVTVAGQLRASGVMPSQRKFTVTSPAAVRGYPTSLSSGDSGYYARFQVEKLTPFGAVDGLGLRPFAFFDVGEAFDSTDTALGTAASVGAGLSISIGRNGFGDVYVAKPLTTGITGWASPSKDPTLGASFSLVF